MTAAEARRILAAAEMVCAAEEVRMALDRMGGEIAARLADANPLVLSVMNGAVFLAGQLLPRLAFPLECDYIHATRYRNTTQGQGIDWVMDPRTPVVGRTVLLLDDILDEGVTLAAARERLLARGARNCLTAVLAEKDIGRAKPIAADFVGLHVPDRYVFGCGMDINGYWRNLPAIFAVRDSA
jgi:hypoxanthine phosphoribosyltransferase